MTAQLHTRATRACSPAMFASIFGVDFRCASHSGTPAVRRSGVAGGPLCVPAAGRSALARSHGAYRAAALRRPCMASRSFCSTIAPPRTPDCACAPSPQNKPHPHTSPHRAALLRKGALRNLPRGAVASCHAACPRPLACIDLSCSHCASSARPPRPPPSVCDGSVMGV